MRTFVNRRVAALAALLTELVAHEATSDLEVGRVMDADKLLTPDEYELHARDWIARRQRELPWLDRVFVSEEVGEWGILRTRREAEQMRTQMRKAGRLTNYMMPGMDVLRNTEVVAARLKVFRDGTEALRAMK